MKRQSACILVLWAVSCGPAPSASPLAAKHVAAPQASTTASTPAAATTSAPAQTPDPPAESEEKAWTLSVSTQGHRIIRTRENDVVVRDPKGAVVFSLGPMNRATFDRAGKLIYAWNGTTGALYDVASAKKIAERKLSVEEFNGAGFSENGSRIIEVGEGIRFVSVPDLKVTFEVKGHYSELHQSAHRAFTLRQTAPKTKEAQLDITLTLIDIDKEKIIGTLPLNEAYVRMPKIAFSADGKKMSLSLAGTRVWDTTVNKVITLEGGELPEHERYEPSAAYFSPDSNSLCVTQMGAMRTISIFNVPKGMVRHCFIVSREGWASEVSQEDASAKLVNVPLTRGTSHPSGLYGLYYRITMDALSSDQQTVAVIERSPNEVNGAFEAWLVIADVETSQVKHRVALPPISAAVHQFEVSFVDKGQSVLVWNEDEGKGVTVDIATGTSRAAPAK